LLLRSSILPFSRSISGSSSLVESARLPSAARFPARSFLQDSGPPFSSPALRLSAFAGLQSVQLSQSLPSRFSFRFVASRTESAAISVSTDAASSGGPVLFAVIGGAAAAIAVVLALAVCIRRHRPCGSVSWDRRSSPSEGPAGETLHGVLLTTMDGLPATDDRTTSTLAMCPTRVSQTADMWEFSDT
jgi:hypothetical protein